MGKEVAILESSKPRAEFCQRVQPAQRQAAKPLRSLTRLALLQQTINGECREPETKSRVLGCGVGRMGCIEQSIAKLTTAEADHASPAK